MKMKFTRGFTLIELLIVIALLGALVVGLLAALDPVEQINRGRDSGTESSASELLNAFNRYYSANGQYPWGAAALGVALANAAGPSGHINTIITAGELKSNFPTNAASTLSRIYVSAAANGPLTVCFQPTSKAFRTNPATIFTNAGAAGPAACPSAALNTCHRCYN